MSTDRSAGHRRAGLTATLRSTLREAAEESALTGRPNTAALSGLRESGLLATAVPKEYGGLGGSAPEVNRVVEQLAVVNPSIAIIAYQHCSVALRIAVWGTPAQKAGLLPRLADGSWLAASAWSEGASRPGIRHADSTAVQGGDGHWTLQGVKAFTTAACLADLYLVLVHTPPPTTAAGTGPREPRTFFLLPSSTPGLYPELSLDLAGMRGSATGVVSLRRCSAPDACRLGPPGDAQAIIAEGRATGATLGAVAVGIAQAAMDYAVQHATHSGLLARQLVRHRLTDLATRLEAARGIVERAGACTAPRPELTTLHSKLFASTTAEELCLEAARLLGSSGYQSGAVLPRLLADARGVSLMGPSNELCRQLLALSWLNKDGPKPPA
ncbi:acyl-CoA dehydrogenase family protein [Streptomyces sp. NPDC086766]|uniref:acyl-CoA dehydrogenase family protein n=1 Tax=Streptomyces sp. NPDC086766 TaxID=3365754 RepID=UPI0037FAE6E7